MARLRADLARVLPGYDASVIGSIVESMEQAGGRAEAESVAEVSLRLSDRIGSITGCMAAPRGRCLGSATPTSPPPTHTPLTTTLVPLARQMFLEGQEEALKVVRAHLAGKGGGLAGQQQPGARPPPQAQQQQAQQQQQQQQPEPTSYFPGGAPKQRAAGQGPAGASSSSPSHPPAASGGDAPDIRYAVSASPAKGVQKGRGGPAAPLAAEPSSSYSGAGAADEVRAAGGLSFVFPKQLNREVLLRGVGVGVGVGRG